MTGWSKGRRRAATLSVVGAVAAIAVLLALPLTSLGSTNPISKLGSQLSTALKGATTHVQSSVQKVAPSATRSSTIARPNSTSNSAPAQSSSSTYTPPAYGTNPHGQGTVGSISLGPSQTRPYTYSPAGSASQNEQVVIGRGRSEQQADGTYDAHTTILALFGNELLGVDANQGQTAGSPVAPLQTALDQICKGSSDLVCLTLLAADTSATSSGAATHFEAVGVHVAPPGAPVLGADVASSDSAIATSGGCQTAAGASQVANATLFGHELANAATSSTKSQAGTCMGGTSQMDDSRVLGLGTSFVPLPAAGCADGTANTDGGIPILLPIICNADDQTQVQAPFGVREALTVLGLNSALNQALIRAATAASESHAVAPPATSTCTDSDKDCGAGETCDANGNDPDGDSDCTGGTGPSGQNKCKDADHDCGKGEVCVNGADPDGDGDCTVATTPSGQKCPDSDRDCGIGPNGQREVCVNSSDPDADADCSNQVTALAAKTTLPFTGENVLLVIFVGLLLTGGGLALATRLRTSSQKRK